MSRTLKALIIGGSFCLLGLIIFFIGYHFNDNRLDNIISFEATKEDPLILKKYESVKPSSLGIINITTKRMPVTIKSHDEDYLMLEYYENQDQLFEVLESNGKLFLKKKDTSFLKEFITSNVLAYIKKDLVSGIILHIPSSYKGELIVNTTFGDISIPDSLAFNQIRKIDFKNTFADINLKSLSGTTLNLKTTRGNIDCSDIRFKNITLIASNATVHFDYIESDNIDIVSNKSTIEGTNILSSNLNLDAKSSKSRLSLWEYSSQYSVEVNKTGNSDVNILESILEDLPKRLTIKASDSTIRIFFSRDK